MAHVARECSGHKVSKSVFKKGDKLEVGKSGNGRSSKAASEFRWARMPPDLASDFHRQLIQ